MTAVLVSILGTIGTALILIIAYIIKGALAGAGKKGAEHVWDNREEYKKWWWNRRSRK